MRRKKWTSTTYFWRQFFCSTRFLWFVFFVPSIGSSLDSSFGSQVFLCRQGLPWWFKLTVHFWWPTVPTASKVCKPLYCSSASKTWRKLTCFCLKNGPFEGVHFLLEMGEIPASYVGLSEGKYPSFDIDSGSPRHLTRLSWLVTVMLPTSRMPFSSKKKGPNKHLSNARNPGCFRIMLPSYMGNIMSQYKDPY